MTSGTQYVVLDSFLSDSESKQAQAALRDIPMYSTQDAVYRCRTTCYGGFPATEPYEPMPDWLANIRWRVELNAGVHYTHFNAVAVVCLAVDGDCVQWHALPRQHVGGLARMAIVTLDGAAVFQTLLPPLSLNQPVHAPTVEVCAGQLVLVPPRMAVSGQWRLDRPVARKRKTEPPASWHLVFFRLLDTRSVLQQQAVRLLYQTFRYGTQLARVLREPHFKLALQVAVGTDTRMRQLLLEELMPVKKERRTVVKQESNPAVKKEPL